MVARKHWCVLLKGEREERERKRQWAWIFYEGIEEEDLFMKYERTNYYLFAPNTRTWPGACKERKALS